MAGLRVPVGVIAPFFSLAIALQAVVPFMEKLGHLHITDRMLLPAELQGNRPGAFTNPAHGRFRIATSFAVNQIVQCAQKLRIGKCEALVSPAHASNSA